MVLVAAGGIGGWALNRYVIDHVEIGDVAAYEAQFNAQWASSTTTGATTASTAPTASTAMTAAAAATPTITDTSYTNGATTITIEKVVTGSGADRGAVAT